MGDLIIGDRGPKGQLGSKGGYVRQDWGGETGEKIEDGERERSGEKGWESPKNNMRNSRAVKIK